MSQSACRAHAGCGSRRKRRLQSRQFLPKRAGDEVIDPVDTARDALTRGTLMRFRDDDRLRLARGIPQPCARTIVRSTNYTSHWSALPFVMAWHSASHHYLLSSVRPRTTLGQLISDNLISTSASADCRARSVKAPVGRQSGNGTVLK